MLVLIFTYFQIGIVFNRHLNIFHADASSGWPAIKLRILHELIYSARRMGDAAIAIRYAVRCDDQDFKYRRSYNYLRG